jgi:aminoglycoside 2'-N-acetyltransferase I
MKREIQLEIKHTAQLNQEALTKVRALLEATFGEDFSEEDWQHTLGGLHILAWNNHELVGHAAVVQRQLLLKGRALRTGYVEAMAVHPSKQKQGIGVTLMEQVEQIIRGAYELGALGASDEGLRLYQKCGWQPWRGRALAFTPQGIIHTHEEDCLYILEVDETIDREADITCEFREGDLW